MTDVEYLCHADAEFLQNGSCFIEFRRRALAFQREKLTFRPQQRQGPPGESLKGSDGPGGDDVNGVLTGDLLGTCPAYGDVRERQEINAFLKKDSTPQKRLQECYRQIRSHDRENDTRQAGARAHVNDVRRVGDQLGQNGTVEHVPVPEALDLARSDETALDAGTGQERGVPLGEGKRVPEDLAGGRRRRK
ncbi:hypothetical protein Airi02_058250 [Actinoallomurus iriomotensis]|uniref:Uncharacterized protein n=1 Tax=Actinoallomurus iriomotensis TaxID=478107 RepID=A0A9W6S3H9_9ACTN|nr:hypothetical protein Airi02_058250 [Actinoallomurus iriomotensis]